MSSRSIGAARRVGATLIPALACVLPTDPVTGLEVIWSLTEQEASDGDDARRPRTCAGARLERVSVRLRDEGDPERARTFAYACEVGYQTADEIATLPSPVFFDLRPGDYSLKATANGPAGPIVVETTLRVGEAGVARATLDLSPPLAPWTLALAGADACVDLQLALRYAEAADDLADPGGGGPPDAGQGEGSEGGEGSAADADDALYRVALTSDRGLVLGGAPTACAEALAGAHAFLVDPGRYDLEVVVDGRRCLLPLEITAASPGVTLLDLAKLPCDG